MYICAMNGGDDRCLIGDIYLADQGTVRKALHHTEDLEHVSRL